MGGDQSPSTDDPVGYLENWVQMTLFFPEELQLYILTFY